MTTPCNGDCDCAEPCASCPSASRLPFLAPIPPFAVAEFTANWLPLRSAAVGTDLAQCADRRSQRVRQQPRSAGTSPDSPLASSEGKHRG